MKRLIAGLLLVILLLGTFACSEASAPAPAPAPAPMPAPAPQKSIFGGLGGADSESSVVVTQIPAPVISIPAPAPASLESGESWAGERMIIRTGDMTLVVVDVAQSIEQVTSLVSNYQGFVVSSNIWKERDRLMGTISFRVPAARFDDALRALRQMAVEVTSESTSGQDVTEEYVDLSAKLRNLEAAEAQLLKLMEEKTEKVTDVLEVQRELVKTRGDIEQTKGRMQYLEKSSSMSLIQVNLQQSKLDVEFTASTRNVKSGEKVWFSPSIAGGSAPYSFEWDFGDGSAINTDETPTHAYKSDGSYTVKLKVTDDRGNTAPYERADYITVLPGWSAGNTASSAWHGLAAFGRVLVDILIWVVYFIPLWIVIGVILYFAWWRRRKKA